MLDLRRDIRLRYAMLFKNHGEAAGATLEHSHSQLIALPIVPHLVAEEMAGCREYYQYKERCIFCDIVRQEIQQGERIVLENGDFVVHRPLRLFFSLRSLDPSQDDIIPSSRTCQVHEIQSLA